MNDCELCILCFKYDQKYRDDLSCRVSETILCACSSIEDWNFVSWMQGITGCYYGRGDICLVWAIRLCPDAKYTFRKCVGLIYSLHHKTID